MDRARRDGSGWGMRLLAVVGLLTLIPALVLVGMRFAPSQSYLPAAQAVGLFPVAALLALVAALCLAGARWRWTAGVAAVVAVVTLVVVFERTTDSTVTATDSTATVQVGAANAYFGRADVGALAAQLRELDVACVAEATPDLAAALAREGMDAYHAVDASEGGASGTVLYSRWPIREVAQVEGVSFRMPRAVVTTPSGAEVTVTCAHPAPPNPSQRALDLWSQELRAVRDAVADTDGAQIVMGDFNATWDHRLLREVAAAGDLRDVAVVAGQGLTPTWPLRDGPSPIPLFPIDHVLTDLDVVDVVIEDVAGSDHRLVTATLTTAPA
ncbi:MAG TPA: endonuclease/exonuclease/phosphatase family protein, partial [Intrasporangiaceae bacterium]|nr:endonuclease/exonuclease/phosphatase family protein [Intrasporangiaceae bacterium]